MTRANLFCEIIRNSFLGLAESASSVSEVGWAAYTFLKVSFLFFYKTDLTILNFFAQELQSFSKNYEQSKIKNFNVKFME